MTTGGIRCAPLQWENKAIPHFDAQNGGAPNSTGWHVKSNFKSNFLNF